MTQSQAEHILSGTCTLKDALAYAGCTQHETEEALRICKNGGKAEYEAYMRMLSNKAQRFIDQLKEMP